VLGIARDLPRANALLDATRPDLAILDIQLVGATSIPVAQRCLATGTAVLFTTGYLAADIPPECAGYPVLAKPFSLEQLRACLEQAFPVETLGQGAGEQRAPVAGSPAIAAGDPSRPVILRAGSVLPNRSAPGTRRRN